MGKGDIKTKRGKIVNKSSGVRRKKKSKTNTPSAKISVVVEKPAAESVVKSAPKKVVKKPKKAAETE